MADDRVNFVAAVGGEADQNLTRGLCIGDPLGRELAELVVGQEHGVDGLRKHHAGRGLVAELVVLAGANGLIEGGGAGEVADWQSDEDKLGHGGLLSKGVRAPRTDGGPPIRQETWVIFMLFCAVLSSLRAAGWAKRSVPTSINWQTVGTARARLCPPYKLTYPALTSRSGSAWSGRPGSRARTAAG